MVSTSGYIDLGALGCIVKSKVYAENIEDAAAIMQRYGLVAYTPIKNMDKGFCLYELELYNETLDRVAILLRRLVDETPHANRGGSRYCLNDFNNSLFLQESYDVLHQILRPGRFTLHLLQDQFPEAVYDTGLGDYVCAGANGGVAATQWHQDWDLPGHVICVSVFAHEITDYDAPMLIALGDEIIKCTGPKGTILMRDVAVWHKGTAKTGNVDRIMPSYRFATIHAQRLGYGVSKKLKPRTAAKFPPCIRKFLAKRIHEMPLSGIWQAPIATSDDHNIEEEHAVAPVLDETVGKRLRSALLKLCPCLNIMEEKKIFSKHDKKKPADEKTEGKQLHDSRPGSMYSLQ